MPEPSVTTIPALTDAEIQERVGSQSFQRGTRYFHDHAIFDARRQGSTLKARSLGSSGGPYRLHVTFGPDGIASANCSCPVGSGGYCKHIAALLLTWRERPEEFLAVEDLNTALERRSKRELIALVKQMLRQEPELESLLEVPLPASGKRATPVDPAIYRRRVAAVFAQAGRRWDERGGLIEELFAITAIGEGFVQQQDYAGAAAVYEAVVLELLEQFPVYQDDDGSLGEVISECVNGLSGCLEHELAAEPRERMLRVLFALYRFDVDYGGVGLAEDALDLMLEQTSAEERHTIAGWVRDAMPAGGSRTTSWSREAYGGLLLDLELDTLDDEAFLRICRESGRTNDLVDRLLALGRTEEAVHAAERVEDFDLLTVAGIFEQHGQSKLAEQLVSKRSETTQDVRLLEWLKDRARHRGDPGAALAYAEEVLRARPHLAGYQELRDLAHEADRLGHPAHLSWEALRGTLLDFLREQGWHDLLIVIYLDEGDAGQALKTLNARASPLMRYSYDLYGHEPLALQVARAAAATQPEAALEIYREQVQRLIDGRNRNSYAEAARLLVEMREIHIGQGDEEGWERYLEELREQHRSLRALKEELAIAGL